VISVNQALDWLGIKYYFANQLVGAMVKAALTELLAELKNVTTPMVVERIVTDIDEIVRLVRFPLIKISTSFHIASALRFFKISHQAVPAITSRRCKSDRFLLPHQIVAFSTGFVQISKQ
jgi:hypothetical protein